MRIEDGKFYRRRDGVVVGPATDTKDGSGYPINMPDPDFPGYVDWYTEEGRYHTSRREHPRDLVEEVPAPAPAAKPALQVEEGKFYRRRDGVVVGPAARVERCDDSPYEWEVQGLTYTDDGVWWLDSSDDPNDLVEEVPDPNAPAAKPDDFDDSVYGGPIPAPEPKQESPRFRVGDRVRDVTDTSYPPATVRAVNGAEVKVHYDGERFDEADPWWPDTDYELIDDEADGVGETDVSASTFGDLNRYPDDNPKTLVGLSKPSLRAIPPLALAHLGRAMANGEAKYGRFNWRDKRVTSSVYYDAMLRHLLAWWDGEDEAADSNAHHLAHIMACCSILLDAESIGALNDDRRRDGQTSALLEAWTEV